MPDTAPQPPSPRRPREPSPPPAPDDAQEPPPEGAIFRALVEAGASNMVAYTADQRIQRMTSEAAATQLQPFMVEMRQLFATQEQRFNERFDAHERRFDKLERRLDALAEDAAVRDRKLDVLAARVEGLKVLVHLVLGALAVLTTALIAVFGILFAA